MIVILECDRVLRFVFECVDESVFLSFVLRAGYYIFYDVMLYFGRPVLS